MSNLEITTISVVLASFLLFFVAVFIPEQSDD